MVAEDLNNITTDMDNSAWLLKYAYFLIYRDECISDKKPCWKHDFSTNNRRNFSVEFCLKFK